MDAGTDKSSIQHNYTKTYAKYFAAIKDQPLKFLEIGIYHGHSVRLWEKYFSHAELHFIDINPSLIVYTPERAHYHFLDQSSVEQLTAFINTVGGEFDIIIDDGGHTMQQQFVSFVTLFPHIKSGGFYVIEDLCTSYWKEYGGDGSFDNPIAGQNTMMGFLRTLIDYLNHSGARTCCADIEKTPPHIRQQFNYFQEHVESIHFYNSLCIIEKR